MTEVDLVVIGAGPGGYAAAFRAADLGLSVALVDAAEKPGGVCLRVGCIPSKALLHVARVVREAGDAREMGVAFEEPSIDLDALREWKSGIVDKLASGVESMARGREVPLHRARARFLDSRTVELEGDDVPGKIRFGHAILATGSAPVVPDALALDDDRVMDSAGALALPDVPRSLLVVGGGYIGLELGQVYAALGSRVTVVEITGGLLPGMDRDLVKPLARRLEKEFEATDLSTKVTAMEPTDAGIRARMEGAGVEPERIFDRVLVAAGRRPDTAGLGLENTDVETGDDGFVETDRRGFTADPNILAIGDVAGEPMLAHKATREGRVAAEAVAGRESEFDNRAIPAVVFTDPEIAWCGELEGEAARVDWRASGRALTLGRPDGVTKLFFDKDTRRLAGMGASGAGASALVAEAALAIEMGAVAEDLASTIHTHPTLAETIGEAAEKFLGRERRRA